MKKVILIAAIIFTNLVMTSCTTDEILNNENNRHENSDINNVDYGGNGNTTPPKTKP